jgi:hypothetical protein
LFPSFSNAKQRLLTVPAKRKQAENGSKKARPDRQHLLKRGPKSKTVLSTIVTQSTHESFVRDEVATPGSDRTFGLVMAAALAVLSLVNGWHHGRLWPWMLLVAVLLAAAGWLKPSWLHPLNRAWMMLGLVLHKIVNPIVMGLLFYGTILPTGLVMRMRGRDLLRLKREPASETYWIARPPGPQPETMRDQF